MPRISAKLATTGWFLLMCSGIIAGIICLRGSEIRGLLAIALSVQCAHTFLLAALLLRADGE
jgi:hypothetical protein